MHIEINAFFEVFHWVITMGMLVLIYTKVEAILNSLKRK